MSNLSIRHQFRCSAYNTPIHVMRGNTLVLICALALAKAEVVRLNSAGCPIDITVDSGLYPNCNRNIRHYNAVDTSDPKQAPTICAAPGSDSILVAHEHCNRFYQCWDGKPIAMSCYGDLQYNPALEICDWPSSVECGARIIPECDEDDDQDNDEETPDICAAENSRDVLLPHNECNKFYKCEGGHLVTYTCPGNLMYNPTAGYCDCSCTVVCGDRVIPDSNGNGSGNGDSGNGSIGAGNSDPSEAENICAKEGSDGVLVANEQCNKFYTCDNGIPVAQNCPAGLLFNPAKDVCDWPANVECGDRIISENESEEDNNSGNGDSGNGGSGNGDSGNGDSGNGSNGAGNCDPSEAGNICAKEGSDGVLVANEQCNKFYKCNNGVPVPQSCPAGLLFNPAKDVCDWPANVACGDRIIIENESEEENSSNGDSGNGGSGNGDSGNGDSGNGGNGAGNCDPGEAGNICAQEGSDGVLVANEECNKFYKCDNGVPVPQSCPAGLLFNPAKDVCDWPANVDCGDRIISENESEEDNNAGNGDSGNGGSGNGGNGDSGNGSNGAGNCDPSEAGNICAKEGSDGVLVANEECNKFYKCDNGVPVPQSCPSGLLFNPAKDVCDWPANVDCGDRIISENESEEDNNAGNGDSGNGGSGNGDSGNGGNGDSGNGGNGAGNCDPSEAGNICAKEGSDGVLVANEECNKFYKCDDGIPVAQSCPAGLLFNPAKDVCDWPANVDCGDRIIKENESEEDNNDGTGNGDPGNGGSGSGDSGNGGNGDSGNGGNGNGGSGTCNCNPGEAASICATPDSEGVLVANENCNQFYVCVGGKTVVMSCPSGLLYNPYSEKCDWPENVDCGDRVTPEDGGSDNGDSGNGGNGDSGNGDSGNGDSGNGDSGNGGNGAGNCDPSEAGNICAHEGSDGVLVANEECNKFYKCDNGVPVPQSCPSGLLFNPAKDVCDWPANVDCGDRIISEKESEEDSNAGNGDSGNGGSGNGDSGNGGNGDSGNGGNGAGNCDPSEAGNICAKEGSDGVLVANEECNKFYKCDNGVPVPQSCPAGLLFNPAKDVCDWPANVDCGDRIISENESEEDSNAGNGDSGNGGSGNGDSGNGGNGDSGNGGNGAGNCDPSEAGNICAKEGSDGVLVANEECNKFYKCDNGVPVPQSCPSGLLFNPAKDVCDWPANVDCGDRIISENESEEDNNAGNGDSGNGGSGNGDSGNGGNGDSGNGGNGAGNCDPSEAGNICAKEGSDGVLVANEECNKFYKCDNGIPVAQSCPAGLLFNPAKDVCDWPANVDCGDRIISENESEEDTNDGNGNGDSGNGGSGNGDSGNGGNGDSGNGGNGNGGSGTCNCNPGEAASICAAPDSEGVLVANENCNQFYVCVGGKNVVMSCPSGLLFNPYAEQCDWPENVNCGDRVIPGDGGSDNGDSGNGGNGDSGNGDSGNGESGNGDSGNGGNGAGNCDPSEAGNICAQEGSDGVLVANEECNKFYKCNNGVPVPQSCPAGLLFNPAKDVCDWPANVDCGDRIISEKESEEDSNAGNGDSGNGGSGNGDSGNGGNGDSGNGGNGAGNCDPSEAGNICAKEGSDGVLVANEECNKFYKCDNGIPVAQSCPAGLLFNPAKDVCDWPANVDCGDRIISEKESEEDSNAGNGDSGNGGSGNGDSGNGGNGDSGNGGNGAGNCDPSEAGNICAKEGSDGVLVANEECNKFYKCDNGIPVAQSCPAGLLFNPAKDVCDWPANVDCGDRIISENESEEDTNDGNGNGDSGNGGSGNGDSGNGGNGDSGNGGNGNGGSGTCNCNPGEAASICAAPDSEGVLVANENCNQFYVCVGGKNVVMSCPSGLLYNPYAEQCDWPENVNCGDRVIPGDGGSDNGDSGNGGNGDSGNGDSGNGESGNGDSGNGGNGAGNCDPSEAGNICAQEGSDGVLVANEECNKFYKCNNGVPVPQSCPAGLLFNPAKDVCDWPANVDCGDRIISEKESEEDSNAGNGDSGNGGSGNGDSGNGGNGDSGNGGNGAGNCDPSEAGNICAKEGSDGVLVANEECNKFYKCDNGVPVAQSCPAGLLFNPAKDVCDWPANVDCGDRIISENESEEDTNDGNGNGDSGNGGSGNGDSGNGGNGDSGNGGNGNGGSGTCNCNPGEAASICAAPDSEGVLVANENCNQFYVCVGGKNVVMSCPSGLLYNPYAEQCDWPENVNCGDRVIPGDGGSDNGDSGNGGNGDSGNGDSGNGESGNGDSGNGGNGAGNCDPSEAGNICAQEGSDGVLVANEECNKFYKCNNGVPVPQSCPAGLLFNPAKDVCDWPANVDCGDRIISEKESEEDSNAGNGDSGNGGSGNGDSGNGGNGDSGNGGNGAGNCDPSEAGNICAKEGSDGVLVANEECNKFYKCDNGVPVAQSCPAGLLFNPAKDVCDWPANVDCGDRIISENESEEDTNDGNGNGDSGNGGSGNGDSGNGGNGDSGNGGNGNGGSGTCNCNPGEAASICAAPDSEGVLVANENCNQFYVCVGGKNLVMSCPSGLLYNPYAEQCDWPENVNCGDRVIPGDGGSDNGDSGNGGNGDSGNGDSGNGDSGNGGNGAGNCDPSEAGNICAKDGSDGVLVAHAQCNKFYKCDNGVPVPQNCPAGLLFNPVLDVCDWAEKVNCGERIIPENESEEDNNSDNGNGDSDNGDSGNGDSGNGGSGTCNCNPGEAASICSNPNAEGVLVANENCNQFYVCVGGKNVVMSCPSGLLYNPYAEQCDWPENVNCGDRVIPEDDGSDNGDSGNGDSGNGDSGNDGSDSGNGSNGGGNCDPSQAGNICAKEGSDGVLVANEQCNKFYKCDNGVPVPQSCPAGLLFNPAKEVCDWPANVDCGDRILPENESEEDNGGDSGNGDSGNGDSGNGDSGNGDSGTCRCNPSEAASICSGPGSDGVLVAHENCNQFYVCVEGKNVTLSCPSGLLYNPYAEQCDWPSNVDCGDRICPESDSTDNGDSGNGGNGDSGNGESDNGGNGAGNCDPSQANNICSQEDSDGVLVAHEKCNKFYKCSGGIPEPQNCPASLLFNPAEDICDWPANVVCGDRIIPENESEEDNHENDNSSSSESSSEESDNGESGSCNCNPNEAAAICSGPGSEGTLVAHENCHQFYVCLGGTNVTLDCPNGLLYSPNKLVCDWPESVNCGDRLVPGGVVEVEEEEKELSNYDNAVAMCALEGSAGKTYPHEDCNRYYMCANYQPVVYRCGSTLLYDLTRQRCFWQENVNCGDRTPTMATSFNKHLEGRQSLRN